MKETTTRPVPRGLFLAGAAAVLLVGAVAPAAAQEVLPGAGEAPTATRSALDFLAAGGVIGIVIVLLSFVGLALTIDGFVRLSPRKLLPDPLAQQAEALAAKGKFADILTLTSGSDSMLGRIIHAALGDGQMGIAAVREAMQTAGTGEMTRLQQRIGYIGFIASVAPMLGLLGTVTGMIASFNVLGMAKGAARPDELAVGISEALVTTCLGLVVAVPLMFFHSYLLDRVTRISQQTAGRCDRLLRIMTAWMERRQAAGTSA
ncbi:MAG: MotA/TolQ/ExbB proton channel family protein [Planctomycetes bacterium]|nr:MotA/TolQ/ExbB proton channel family protein [Planctomycetota bacterium]